MSMLEQPCPLSNITNRVRLCLRSLAAYSTSAVVRTMARIQAIKILDVCTEIAKYNGAANSCQQKLN